ncbi:probable ubiquinone biosynthesis protein Coq7 [Phialocephala subalpina]|uniref:5-demethoxyubiquinone hydroxylase, mitochondrial n=1 Tax=Phialocephala subalpina TaxID=576137 RepID=A0A1L7X4E4_9HELO|nr:probable ubiquinone biosynthesis protein Coq7 [Phialocephala subalpina]
MALCSSARRSAILATHLPTYDFLLPCLLPRITHQNRHLSRSRRLYSAENDGAFANTSAKPLRAPKSAPEAASNPVPRNKPLTQAQRDFLASALRVNQAGELAACLIYAAQTPVVVVAHPHLRPLMKHMYDQEAGHFSTFNKLIAKHRVRPTAMYPVWKVAASALGWGTAIMGREAAMACTEAVETEIGTHYNDQVRWLLDMAEQMERSGEELGDDLKELIITVRRIRDEELEHLDHAVENDAQKAVPHELLTSFIRAGCRGAIWVSERV